MPADHPVCLVGNRGFVDDCVVDSALNAVLLTPVLRKDVMNIQRKLLVVELLDLCLLEEVLRAFAKHQHIQALVRG